jgi:hypothetical protein
MTACFRWVLYEGVFGCAGQKSRMLKGEASLRRLAAEPDLARDLSSRLGLEKTSAGTPWIWMPKPHYLDLSSNLGRGVWPPGFSRPQIRVGHPAALQRP